MKKLLFLALVFLSTCLIAQTNTFSAITISKSDPNIGGEIYIGNPFKTAPGQASTWSIYNMSGAYGNSLQFWAYDNIGCSAGGMCNNKFTLMDNGNVGIGTASPLAKFHVAGDGYSLFGPNSTWGALLRVGGNGNITNDASVVATNGNLHLDGAIGNYGTYLNYYHGSAGILFGNGAQSIIGTISGAGNLAMNGTGTFGTNTFINGQGDSYLNGGNVGIGITTVGVQTKFHVKEIGSSVNTWKGRIVASGDNSAVVMGERNGKAWLGGHNAALSAWSDLILQADGGNIGIGTQNPDEKLTVNGVIHAREVRVDLSGPLADYVFKPNYKLMSLPQVEKFVKVNNHLPQMPSANEVAKNGLSMGEMQNKLLQKVEELTLYAIQQNRKIEAIQIENEQYKAERTNLLTEQAQSIAEQQRQLSELKKEINTLKRK